MRRSTFQIFGWRKKLRENSGTWFSALPAAVRPPLTPPAGLPDVPAEYVFPEAAMKTGAKVKPLKSARATFRSLPKNLGDQTALAANLWRMSKFAGASSRLKSRGLNGVLVVVNVIEACPLSVAFESV